MPFRCRGKGCRKRFSVRTGTVMQSSRLGYQIWVIAMYLVATNLKGVSSMKLHRDLGVTQKTAWYLAHRIRSCMQGDLEVFMGPIEADETYIGGLESNKHKRNRLNAGCGTVGKVAVVGIRDRKTKRVQAQVVASTDKQTLQAFVQRWSGPGVKIYTDEARAYIGLVNHESVKHSLKEFVRGMAHVNGMESFWALLKRGYHGIYHHMSPKHLQRYVDEFAGRHNFRPRATLTQMRMMVDGMVGKRMTYKDLIASFEQ